MSEARSNRRLDLEVLRVLSALCIVIFHAKVYGESVAYSGLIVFAEMSIYFACINNRGFLPFFRSIFIPYVIWYVIYVGINIAKHGTPLPFDTNGPIGAVLMGPSAHLWYIPYILFFTFVTLQVRSRVDERTLSIAACVLIVLFAVTTALWRPWSMNVGAPVAQWVHGIPAVLFGIILIERETRLRLALVAVALLCFAFQIPWDGVGIPYLLGSAAFAGCILAGNWSSASAGRFREISKCMGGVYFIHILALMIVRQAFSGLTFVGVLLAFVVSTAIVFVSYRISGKLSRYVFG